MKLKILYLTLFFPLLACSQKNFIDIIHYKFEIELSDKSDTIKGQAEIKLKYLQSLSSFKLDLVQSTQGQGMKVQKITGNNISSFTKGTDDITISLLPGIKIGDTATFTIIYSGIPAEGLIISKNRYGHRCFFSDNWPNRAHNWIPCIDDPADKAAVEFIVTAPSHYQVISNGLLIEETNLPDNNKITHWKEEVPLPTKVMVIGAADFAVNYIGDVNCVPVSSWVFPENKSEGFNDYRQAKDILSFYINYIGPYPYKKLANVQSKIIFGGMENASAIFYSENSVSGNQQDESLLAHEIVHQWFGNMATEKSFAHLWLSEGFATYFTHIYIETKYGTDSLNKEMQQDRQEVIDFVNTSGKLVVDADTSYMELLNANSYQKGSWVLHMLRRELGDSVFHKSIRQYYATYAGKNAGTDDLRIIFESVSGKDLKKFFSQWLYSSVNPKLKITWKYLWKEKKIKVDIMQIQNETVFNFPINIELSLASGKKMAKTLTVDSQTKSFSFPVSERPLKIEADPATSLLFEGTVTELK